MKNKLEKNNSSKGLITIIIILIILLMCALGYIFYDKLDSNKIDNEENDKYTTTVLKTTTKTESKSEQLTNAQLENLLTFVPNNVFGNAYDNETTKNFEFFEEKAILYQVFKNTTPGNCSDQCVSINEFENNLLKMYNLKLNDFSQSTINDNNNSYISYGNFLIKNNEQFYIGGFGGEIKKVKSIIRNYEFKSNYLIIFEQTGYTLSDEDGIKVCDVKSCENFNVDHLNDDNQNYLESSKKYIDSIEFNTYKHIFKLNDGNYYWFSTEFVK